MARAPWFRFYSEVLYDPKIHRLPIATRWRWVELLCLANDQPERGCLPSLEDVAYALRMTVEKTQELLETLEQSGLLDRQDEGCLHPHNWDGRQFASDLRESDGRKKHDESRRKIDGVWTNVAANAPPLRRESAAIAPQPAEADSDTDSETETEQSRSEQSPYGPRARTEIRQAWESQIGMLPFSLVQEFEEYEKFTPAGWFIEAIGVTKANARRPSWAFCKAVLDGASRRNEPPQLKDRSPPGSLAEIIEARQNGRRR